MKKQSLKHFDSIAHPAPETLQATIYHNNPTSHISNNYRLSKKPELCLPILTSSRIDSRNSINKVIQDLADYSSYKKKFLGQVKKQQNNSYVSLTHENSYHTIQQNYSGNSARREEQLSYIGISRLNNLNKNINPTHKLKSSLKRASQKHLTHHQVEYLRERPSLQAAPHKVEVLIANESSTHELKRFNQPTESKHASLHSETKTYGSSRCQDERRRQHNNILKAIQNYRSKHNQTVCSIVSSEAETSIEVAHLGLYKHQPSSRQTYNPYEMQTREYSTQSLHEQQIEGRGLKQRLSQTKQLVKYLGESMGDKIYSSSSKNNKFQMSPRNENNSQNKYKTDLVEPSNTITQHSQEKQKPEGFTLVHVSCRRKAVAQDQGAEKPAEKSTLKKSIIIQDVVCSSKKMEGFQTLQPWDIKDNNNQLENYF